MLRTCSGCGQANRVPAEHLHQTGRCGRCKAALPASSTPIDVTDTTMFDDIVAHARVPVLVDFWATWCGPCRMVAPEVQKLAQQLAGQAIVLKVDTDRLGELANRYRVQGIPNFAVFDHGELLRQQAGAMRAADLARLIPGARAA